LLPRAVLPNEVPEVVYMEMFIALVQETGADQPLVHTTRSYLYDLDHLMVSLSLESEQLHQGFYESVRHIDVLEHEIQGWNRIYTTAWVEARKNRVNYVESNLRCEAEAQLRMAAEVKLLQSETELQKLQAEKAEWELKEKVEDKVKELETRLERNKRNIAMLTRTAVYLRDKAARAMQTWEISDLIRIDEIHELRNQLPEESQPMVRKEDFKLIPPSSAYTCAPTRRWHLPSRLRRWWRPSQPSTPSSQKTTQRTTITC
jgi:hypothetical protein